MQIVLDRPNFIPTHENIAALDRLGDEIAELAGHLEAATARLLELIREFDARGGWNTGSCTSTRLFWLRWPSPGSQFSKKAGGTFPRERRSAWRAMPPGW